MGISSFFEEGKSGRSLANIVAELSLEFRSSKVHASAFLGFLREDLYRMRKIPTSNHVLFVDDSRSTNVNSAWYALEETPAPIVWIVGGVDKGGDYSTIFDVVSKKVHSIVVLGGGHSELYRSFGRLVYEVKAANGMVEAVMMAHTIARDLEGRPTVLLSPACASFDLFESFEDRGRQFDEVVRDRYLS